MMDYTVAQYDSCGSGNIQEMYTNINGDGIHPEFIYFAVPELDNEAGRKLVNSKRK